MNRLTKQYEDTKRYYSTHTCDEVLQKLGRLEDKEEYKPTLEEVKKEWEELEWKWEEDVEIIRLRQYFSYEIFINKEDMTYKSNISLNIIEHQLLTKTFRALGWFDAN